jgi:hypothetical protein
MVQTIFNIYHSCLCIFIRNVQKLVFVTLLGAFSICLRSRRCRTSRDAISVEQVGKLNE